MIYPSGVFLRSESVWALVKTNAAHVFIMSAQMIMEAQSAIAIRRGFRPPRQARGGYRGLFDLIKIKRQRSAITIENPSVDHRQPDIGALCAREESFKQWHVWIEIGRARPLERDG